MTTHKIIIAGCGGMSNIWFDYAIARENAEVVGVVDIFEENARSMLQKKKSWMYLYSPT